MARTSSSRGAAAFKLRTGNSPLYKSLSGSPVKKMVYPATFGLSGTSAPKINLSGNVEEIKDIRKHAEGDGPNLPVSPTVPNNQLLSTLSNSLESEILDEVEAPDYDTDEGTGSLYDYSVRKNPSAITKKSPSKMGKGKRVFKMKRK